MTPQDIKTLARMIASELFDLQTNAKVLISKNEAYRLYGRSKVDRLIKIGRVQPRKEGNRVIINRKQIEV
jgi:hypothetical protein